jgi:hypothetical protein
VAGRAGRDEPGRNAGLGHLSDPDLVFDPDTRELLLYYRQATGDNVIWLIRSSDGVSWSAPVEVLRRPSHEIVSPTVVRKAPSEWYLWAVNSGDIGCGAPSTVVELRRSTDGVHWSKPEPLDFPLPELWPWHIEVRWIEARAEFWAVFNAKTESGCTTPAVFIARSANGVEWTVVGTPVIAKGRVEVFQDLVYRTTFDYEPGSDMITFWYSGARFAASGYQWGAAVERRPREEVFASAKAEPDPLWYDEPPAPLVEWP